MLFGFNLNHLFLFPVADDEARKNFLIGALLILASFIIPIIPYLLVMGYTLRIMRQVIEGERPRMIAWGDWEGLLTDGLKLFGIRFVYSLPFLLFILPLMLALWSLPMLAAALEEEGLFLAWLVAFPLFFACFIPVSLVFAILLPAPEAHVAATREFSAGFRIREWWPIFRKNLGGFVVAFLIFYGISMLLALAIQIMMMTIILLCLLPLLVPVISMYLTVVQYVLFAQAYREGREKLAAAPMTSA